MTNNSTKNDTESITEQPQAPDFVISIALPCLAAAIILSMITIGCWLRRSKVHEMAFVAENDLERLEHLQRECKAELYTYWRSRLLKDTKHPKLYANSLVWLVPDVDHFAKSEDS